MTPDDLIEKHLTEIESFELSMIGKIRKMSKVITGIAILSLLISVGVFYIGWTGSNGGESVYSPLGEYPLQLLDTDNRTEDGIKYVQIGSVVRISGVKCNDSVSDVRVEGSITWQAIDPPGSVVESGFGYSTRIPGCQTLRYANVMPEEVIDAVSQQYEQGIENPVWRISGIEFPIDPDTGERGEPRRFISESFVIKI